MIDYTIYDCEKNGNIIDRNELISRLKNGMDALDVVLEILNMPTVDDFPVVRCKDCKFYDNEKCMCNHFDMFFELNEFCSRGERKRDEDKA